MAMKVAARSWNWYQGQLTRNPVTTQVISSGMLWATGDVAAQYVNFRIKNKNMVKAKKSFKVDWKRVMTTSMFGFGFVGPLGHYWYLGLEKVALNTFRMQPGSLKLVSAKLAVDTIFFGPFHVGCFLAYMGLASGKTFGQVKEEVKRDFIPALIAEVTVWPVVQTVNFKFVPVKYQLLYVNVFCLLDSTFLSWFEQQQDAKWKRWVSSLFSRNPTEHNQIQQK